MKTWCTLILLFSIAISCAQASASDSDAAYKAALPLYKDNPHTSLAVQVASDSPEPGGHLIRLSYAGMGGERVPALLFIPTAASKSHPAPCVFALHGLGGSKEQMEAFGLAALSGGYATFAIDEYGQGQRPHVQSPGGILAMGVLATGIEHTVVDTRRGLDYLDTRSDIDHRHIGLFGVSLGAIVGTIAAGVDTRIKAVVLISGGGDWALIFKSLADENMVMAGQPMGSLQGTNWAMVGAFLAPVDPVTFAPQIAPRPILMENGRLDKIIVPDAATALYNAASAPKNSHVHIDWFAQSGHVPAWNLVSTNVQKFFTHNLP